MVEKCNKKKEGKMFPLVGFHHLDSRLMMIDEELMEDENTKTTIGKIAEETKKKLQEAMDKAVTAQEKADMEPEIMQNRGFIARKVLKVVGPASLLAKPVAETSYVPLVPYTINTGSRIKEVSLV